MAVDPASARNPKWLTFQEVFSEFGRGTLSSSSPASRRTGFMAFSSHRREPHMEAPRSDRRELSKSAPVLIRSRVTVSPQFDRMNRLLIRSHFSTLFSAMMEEGLLIVSVRDTLRGILDSSSWNVCVWMHHYCSFMADRDTDRFINNLLS